MGPFDLVIFDCDGVLVDSERLSNKIFAELLNEHDCPATLEIMFENFVGHSMAQCHDIVKTLWGKSLPADFDERYRSRRDAAFKADLKIVPGVAAVLNTLEAQGQAYCLASSGSHRKMDITLAVTGLKDRFEGRRFSVSEVERSKPAPDVFLHAAKTMGARPEACAVIEDSPSGVRAGLAAGMTVFAYAAMTPAKRLQKAGAKHLFCAMDELPSLILPP